MKDITVILFERIGLLLIVAFVLTRTPNFKALIYREYSAGMTVVHALIFGLFAIASSHFGIVIQGGEVVNQNFVLTVAPNEMMVSLSLIAVVIAGLLGGPLVGLGTGIIAGIDLAFIGGIGWVANMLVNPLTGILAGLAGQFFSKSRVISPVQALFIGVFPPVLQMQILFVLYPQQPFIMEFVNLTGLPLVLTNAIAIAIFTAMIKIVLQEQENEAALATKQALTIAEAALPILKKESEAERAEGLATLLYDRLDLAAVSVTDQNQVLAFKGIGSEHHHIGHEIKTPISRRALETKEVQIAYSKSDIACDEPTCKLEAAIIIPLIEANDNVSLIKFYFKKVQHIRPVEKELAQGIGQLLSNQSRVISSENLKKSIVDAELRNLQAQINPHFLFNTLHLIATLFRIDPMRARHITIQLANFMRFNLGIASESLITLERETEHVKAYVEIIQARFQNRLQIHFHQEHMRGNILIPPSTIQPLVENAIEHGLKEVTSNGEVHISITNKGDRVEIAVEDNGKGFDEEEIEQFRRRQKSQKMYSGVGMYNVNQRLVSLLGEDAKLSIESKQNRGSKIYFTIPTTFSRGKENEY